MPSFLPQTAVRALAFPECVDLDELFTDQHFANSLDRVISYLHRIYVDFSDGSFERISRLGVITEVFFLKMPTREAYVAEIALMNAIHAHALGNLSDEKIKVYLQKYLDTHIFVYKEIKGVVRQVFKIGDGKLTGRNVPLFYLHNGPNTGGVFNAIQMRLYQRLETKSGNNVKYSIINL